MCVLEYCTKCTLKRSIEMVIVVKTILRHRSVNWNRLDQTRACFGSFHFQFCTILCLSIVWQQLTFDYNLHQIVSTVLIIISIPKSRKHVYWRYYMTCFQLVKQNNARNQVYGGRSANLPFSINLPCVNVRCDILGWYMVGSLYICVQITISHFI